MDEQLVHWRRCYPDLLRLKRNCEAKEKIMLDPRAAYEVMKSGCIGEPMVELAPTDIRRAPDGRLYIEVRTLVSIFERMEK